MKNKFLIFSTLVMQFVALTMHTELRAEETVVEKVQTSTNRAGNKVKHTYRQADNKVCEMVNGKEECVFKKFKNKVKDIKDDMKTNEVESVRKYN